MSDREEARRKALRVARAVTLGLALTTTGCEQVIDRACSAPVVENTRYCCERSGLLWDSHTRSCVAPVVVPGPFTPPDLPA